MEKNTVKSVHGGDASGRGDADTSRSKALDALLHGKAEEEALAGSSGPRDERVLPEAEDGVGDEALVVR